MRGLCESADGRGVEVGGAESMASTGKCSRARFSMWCLMQHLDALSCVSGLLSTLAPH